MKILQFQNCGRPRDICNWKILPGCQVSAPLPSAEKRTKSISETSLFQLVEQMIMFSLRRKSSDLLTHCNVKMTTTRCCVSCHLSTGCQPSYIFRFHDLNEFTLIIIFILFRLLFLCISLKLFHKICFVLSFFFIFQKFIEINRFW